MSDLMHIGVLGMKWGRRKARSSGPDTSSADHKSAVQIKRKKLSEMSNDELKKLTTRLQLEKQYKDLSKVDTTPGQKFVSDILQNTGKQLISKWLAGALESGGKTLIDLIQKKKS